MEPDRLQSSNWTLSRNAKCLAMALSARFDSCWLAALVPKLKVLYVCVQEAVGDKRGMRNFQWVCINGGWTNSSCGRVVRESYHHLAWKQIRHPHRDTELCRLTMFLSLILTDSVSHFVTISVRLIRLNCDDYIWNSSWTLGPDCDASTCLPRRVLHTSSNTYRDKSQPANSGHIFHHLTASCGIA